MDLNMSETCGLEQQVRYSTKLVLPREQCYYHGAPRYEASHIIVTENPTGRDLNTSTWPVDYQRLLHAPFSGEYNDVFGL